MGEDEVGEKRESWNDSFSEDIVTGISDRSEQFDRLLEALGQIGILHAVWVLLKDLGNLLGEEAKDKAVLQFGARTVAGICIRAGLRGRAGERFEVNLR